MPAKTELVNRLGAKSLITVDEKFLDELVQLIVAKGCRYNNQIYPLLNVSESTWVGLKRENPIIQQTLEYAWAVHANKVNGYFDKALHNPKNKNHWDAVKIEKKELSQRNVETTINHNVRVINPALEMSNDDLYNSLVSEQPKVETMVPQNKHIGLADFDPNVDVGEILEEGTDEDVLQFPVLSGRDAEQVVETIKFNIVETIGEDDVIDALLADQSKK